MCTAMLIVSDEVETSKLYHPPWLAPQHLLSSRLPGPAAMAQTQLAQGWPQPGSAAQVWAAQGAAVLFSPSAAGTVVVLGCLMLGGSCSWSHRASAHGAWLSCDSHLPTADTGGIVTQRGTSLHLLTLSHSGEASILHTLHGHPETHPA